MRDDQNTRPALRAELLHQLQNLCFNGDIQGGGRLVCNQQLRSADHRHSDADALSQTAGQLMRVAVIPFLRLRNANLPEHIDNSPLCLFPADFRIMNK